MAIIVGYIVVNVISFIIKKIERLRYRNFDVFLCKVPISSQRVSDTPH